MIRSWYCSICGAEGLIKPLWGDHASDIIADTHRDQSNACDREHGTEGIFLSDPLPTSPTPA